MAGGRPRGIFPTEKEMIELGKDLVEWATEKTDEIRTSFCFWYGLKHSILYEEWKLMKRREEFSPYYQKARAAMAQKLHAQALEKGLSHRYIRMYDRELSDMEDQDKDEDIKRRVNAVKSAGDQQQSYVELLAEKYKPEKG